MSEDPFEMIALDDVTKACVQFVGRTGAQDFQVRYSDDEQPVVWIAVALYGAPGADSAQAAGGLTPREAVYRLVEVPARCSYLLELAPYARPPGARPLIPITAAGRR